jgi:hypothetical protein
MKAGNSTQTQFLSPVPEEEQTDRQMAPTKRIWIDLDNSPHVPFFAPIIDELKKRNFAVEITARDCFQVRELADLFHLEYRLIGRHSGKNKVRKMVGLCFRALRLMPTALRRKPDLALSVCSRSQLIVSSVLGIPSVFMGDYEHATPWLLIHPTWLVTPAVIPKSALHMNPDRVYKYPGIKEDVYVPRFIPDHSIRAALGLEENDIVGTVRPPANEAHYHTPESDELFAATMQFLSKIPEVKLVVLPRNAKQASEVRKRWPDPFSNGKMRIPDRVVDGLNLIWHSDFVISGGGTMNREAAALGVPVYSVFRGKIGAVDQYLAGVGRLVLLESVEDVQTKIVIARRNRPTAPPRRSEAVLREIVQQIINFMNSGHVPTAIHNSSGHNGSGAV